MLAVIAWDGGTDGKGTSFLDAVNWEGDVLPGAADTAVIAATGGTASAITLSGTTTVAEIRSSRPLTLSGGSLAGTKFVASDGAALVATDSGGTLSGVTLAGDLDVADGTVTIQNGLSLEGVTVRIGDRAGNSHGVVTFSGGSQSIAGTGSFVFGSNFNSRMQVRGTSATQELSIGPGITIRGSAGTIEGSVASPIRLVNRGTIAGDASTPRATDLGYDQSAGGSASSFTTAVDRSGVADPLAESVYKNLRSGTALAYAFHGLVPGASHRVRLHVVENTATAAGARRFDVVLNGLTAQANLDVFAESGARYKALAKDYTVAADAEGRIMVDLVGRTGNAIVSALEVFSGDARVASSDAGEKLPGTVVVSATAFENQGTLSAARSGTLSVSGVWTNAAAGSVIGASGGTLFLGGGSTNAWSNLGTISVTDARVTLRGSLTPATLGTVRRTRGTVALGGAFDLTGATLRLDDTTGPWELSGATVTGGRIETTGTASLVASSGRLSGVTFAGDLDVSDGTLSVSNGLSLDTATVRIGDRAGTSTGAITFDGGSQAVTGSGDFVFGSHASNLLNPRGTAATQELTIGPGITIRGNSGTIDGSTSAPIRLVNQGRIAADASTPRPADLGYDNASGGSANSFTTAVDRSGVSDPLPESAYKDYLSGTSIAATFRGLVANASHRVRLHVVEPTATSAGTRRFDVVLNGVTAQANLDVFAESGARFKALAKDYTVAADADGRIRLNLVGRTGSAVVSAIEIFSGESRVASSDFGGKRTATIAIKATDLDNPGTLAAAGSALSVALRRSGATWTNGGTVAVDGSSFFPGTLVATSGSVSLADTTVSLTGDYVQSAGSTVLRNATLDPTGVATIAGGAVSGVGTIKANVTNAGMVSPGGTGIAGTLTIEGSYTQSPGGAVRLELASATLTDRLAVTGATALDGRLDVAALGGYLPASAGLEYDVVTATSLTGTFSAATGLLLGGSKGVTVGYSATKVSLTSRDIVNTAPTDVALSATAVAENAPSGTAVGTFATTDQDDGDSFTYALVAGSGDADNASFGIVGTSLVTAAVFDHETAAARSIRVRATDSGGLSTEKTFTIAVSDRNDAPTDVALSAAIVVENAAAGTVVGLFSTADTDAGDTFVYSLVTGSGDADNASFEIVGGALRTRGPVDHETGPVLSVRVRSTDSGGLSAERVFSITVSDVNEAPATLALSNATIAENDPLGSTVGTFTAADPDAGDSLAYALVAGDGDADNASFEIAGNVLRTRVQLDHAARPVCTVRVRVTDAGGLSTEASFTITVTRPNDPPTDIGLSAAEIAENAPAGGTVGTFTAADPDAGETFTYALVSGAGDAHNASFEIVAGELRTKAPFDHETQPSRTIRVRATDSLGLSTEKAFTIAVTDVNDAPLGIAIENATDSLPESVATASRIRLATIAVTDDALGTNRISLSGAEAGSFEVVASGLYLRAGVRLDFETKPRLDVTLSAADDSLPGTPPVSVAFTLAVSDVDESTFADARPVLDIGKSPSLATFDRGAPLPGSTAGSVLVSSLVDAGGPLANYASPAGNAPGIAITGTNVRGGRLWFSIDAGASWREIGAVSDTFATLLAADDATRLFFSPAPGTFDTLADVITFRAWDRSGGFVNGLTGVNPRIADPVLWSTWDGGEGMALSPDGRYAFSGDYSDGLVVFDIADHSKPTVIGSCAVGDRFRPRNVAISTDGHLAVVVSDDVDRTEVLLVDVSMPRSPAPLGRLISTGRAEDVALSADGRTAFVLMGDFDNAGLLVIDIGDPAAPAAVAFFDTPGEAQSVVLSADGRRAYIADGSAGLSIVDIGTPSSPLLVGRYDTGGSASDVAVSVNGARAIVADGSGGVVVIDVSNPANPAHVVTVSVGGYAGHVALSGDGSLAYVTDFSSDVVYVVDAVDSIAPRVIGSYETAMGGGEIALSGDGHYAYVGGSGLTVIDLLTPPNVPLLGQFSTWAYDVALSATGRYAYVAAGTAGLQVINVLDPAAPKRVGSYDTTGSAVDVTVSATGRYAYVADHSAGVQVFDVSNPSPLRVGGHDTAGSAQRVALSPDGIHAFVADWSGGLVVLDVTRPAAPSRVGGFAVRNAADVALSPDGRYAYVAGWYESMTILDVSTPANPILVGTYGTDCGRVTLSADGQHAFVISSSNLVVLDISTPTSPKELGILSRYDSGLVSGGVAIGGFVSVTLSPDERYAYVGMLENGTQVVDLSDLARPRFIGGLGGVSSRGVALSSDGRRAFVADYTRLIILDATVGRMPFSLATDTVSVTLEASAPPTDISLAPAAVAENSAAGTVVGTLSTTDQNTDDRFTYALVAGSGDADNAAFEIVDGRLLTRALFDHETRTAYAIRVRVTDAAGLAIEKAFAVTVTDVNESPADITLSRATVAENAAPGTVVGTFLATDPDAGDSFTYALVAGSGDADNAAFEIVDGRLLTRALFDYETRTAYAIRVRATDAAGLAIEKAFAVTVTPWNEAPNDILLSESDVAENSPVGTVVGFLTAADSDAGDAHTYTLVAGSGDADNAGFEIVDTRLVTKALFDHEAKASLSVRVRATDAGGLFTEKVFTIDVSDVDEWLPAPVVSLLDDSGASATDRITNDARLSVTGLVGGTTLQFWNPGTNFTGTEQEPNDDGIAGFGTADLDFAQSLAGGFTTVAADRFRAVVTGELSTGKVPDRDVYVVPVRAGDVLRVELAGIDSNAGTLSDPFLTLADDRGRVVAEDDDSGVGWDALVERTIPTDGRVFIVARDRSDEPGTYTLLVTVTRAGSTGADELTTPVAAGWYPSWTPAEGSNVVQARQVDPFGNASDPSTLAFRLDTRGPTLTVSSDRSFLLAGQTAAIALNADEPIAGLAAGDVAATLGALSAFGGSGSTWSAILTPSPRTTGIGTVAVADGSFADVAGNPGIGGSTSILVDTQAIDVFGDPLSIGVAGDGSFFGPTINALWNDVEFLYLQGFTLAIDGSLVTSTYYGNLAGSDAPDFAVTVVDAGVGSAHAVRVEGHPRAGVRFVRTVRWNDGDDHAIVETTLVNESATSIGGLALLDTHNVDPAGFIPTANDVTRAGRLVVSSAAKGAMGLAATDPRAVVSAEGGFVTDPAVVLGSPADPNRKVADISINVAFDIGALAPGASTTCTYAMLFGTSQAVVESLFDDVAFTLAPAVTVAADRTRLAIGQTAAVTFTLSKPADDFTVDDVTVTGGTLSGFAGSGTVYNATFTPDPGITGTGTVTVAARRFTDAAGTPNAAGTLAPSLSIDTAAPVAPRVTLKADTGSSATDRITTDGTLSLSGIEAGALVEYSIDQGTTWTSSFKAAEGRNAFAVRQTDSAGNLSPTTTLDFTLDTVAPAAPVVALKNDSGSSAADLLTNDGTLSLSAIDAGAKVDYSIDGGIKWSTSFKAVQGKNSVSVRQTDAAGNVSTSSALAFTLDTLVLAPTIALKNDTGSSATDRITKDGTLAVAGIEAGARIEYSRDGGAWVPSFVPVAGTNTVRARQTDAAGNVSPVVNLTFTLDTTGPSITGIVLPAAGNYKTGATLSIRVTFSEAVVVSPYTGPASLRASMTPAIELTIGGVKRRATYASGSGTTTLVFSYKIVSTDRHTSASGILFANTIALAAGNWISDAAGNFSSLGFAARLPATLPRIRVNAP